MGIFVNKCYQVVTPESVENGDFADSGFEYQDVEYSFRELVNEMHNFPYPSSSWLESIPDTDYYSGEETIYSLHPSHTGNVKQDAITMRYWEKALRACGYLK